MLPINARRLEVILFKRLVAREKGRLARFWCDEALLGRVRLFHSKSPVAKRTPCGIAYFPVLPASVWRSTRANPNNMYVSVKHSRVGIRRWSCSCLQRLVGNGVDAIFLNQLVRTTASRSCQHGRGAVLRFILRMSKRKKSTVGSVSLVSAGPGDLDLLTFRAASTIAAADVLLVDDLVNNEIVALAPRAHVIYVGKRGGRKSTSQAFIHRLMRRYVLRGQRVVRVKGGDALLFGRAGEELADLRGAGIDVDIVNGISSGFAAAAGLGVSLTHRDHCQGVIFVTAHLRDGSEPDWATLAATGMTLVIYMGAKRIHGICSALKLSLAPNTPVGIV